MLKDVQTILSRKDTTVFTVEPTASIECRALSAKGGAALETPVAEVMTRKVTARCRVPR